MFSVVLSTDRIIFWHFGSICSIFSTSHLDCDFSEAKKKPYKRNCEMLKKTNNCVVCSFLLALKAKMDKSLLLNALCEAQDLKIRDIQVLQEAN